MVLFSKSNLFYKDYSWSLYSNNDPHISGKIDQTDFNPKDGSQVVYLINKLMIQWSYRFTNTGNKMERLIHDQLPPDMLLQEEVQDWIKENLKF